MSHVRDREGRNDLTRHRLIKISVFGFAGDVPARVLALALLIGCIAIPAHSWQKPSPPEQTSEQFDATLIACADLRIAL